MDMKNGGFNHETGTIGYGKLKTTRPSGFTFARILFAKDWLKILKTGLAKEQFTL